MPTPDTDTPYTPTPLLDELTCTEAEILAQLGIPADVIELYAQQWVDRCWPTLAEIIAAGVTE